MQAPFPCFFILKQNEVFMLMLKADPQDASSIAVIHNEVKAKVTISTREDIKSLTLIYTGNTSLVAILITTITFAAAFTLPGGYYQSASDGGVPGTPILARSYAFHAFILADTLAFICSCLATFSLVFAGVPAVDHFIRLKHSNISMRLLFASEISLMASFALGLYLVLAPTAHAIAITVCAISSGAFLFGSMDEAMHMLYDLNTPRARLGIRRLLSTWCDFVPAKCISALIPLIPLIVIFGLPAIIGNPDKTLSSLKVILWKEDIAGFILVSLLIVGWVLPRI